VEILDLVVQPAMPIDATRVLRSAVHSTGSVIVAPAALKRAARRRGTAHALGAGGGAAHGLRAGVVDVGELGAVDPADDGGLPHDIRGEPERGTAECVETVQVLLAELHVGGGKVVSYTRMLWMGLRRKAAYLPGC
jgi:hypothetical protein